MFDPKGPIAQQLTPLLITELTTKYNIPDDAKDVAEYIIMLIGNGRPANEIVAETKEIVSIPIDETFIGTVFAEIGRLETLASQSQEDTSMAVEEKQPRGRNVKFQKGVEARGKFGATTKPRVTRAGVTKGAIGKPGVGKASKDFVAKSHGRKEIPTKPRGQQIQEKRLLEQIQQHMPSLLANQGSEVESCKYGHVCSKELCPFGHPAPANKDARILTPRWCKFNKKCTNKSCAYAHSSPNYLKYTPTKRQATTLEQCKFNNSCTNKGCTRRHATSLVACQRGNDCKLPFCTYNHIIDEECRHKNECANKVCYFKHPDAREVGFLKQNTGGSEPTNERAFAVPEDQVMEQAVQ